MSCSNTTAIDENRQELSSGTTCSKCIGINDWYYIDGIGSVQERRTWMGTHAMDQVPADSLNIVRL